MAWLGLDFTSAAERAKRQRVYQAKALPFGPDQRTAALTVLKTVVESRRRDEELLFAFFHAKQAYQDATEDEENLPPQQAALSALSDLAWLNGPDRQAIAALAILDASAVSLAQYPTVAAVRALSETLG